MNLRGLVVLLACFISSHALATPAFFETLKATYKFSAESEAGKRGCQNCHSQVPQRNVFGKRVEQELGKFNTKILTGEILFAVAKEDSDGDGSANGDELAAGFVAADSASHPEKKETKPAATLETVPKEVEPAKPLIPNHSFHPAVVHFPIALLLVGFVLHILGEKRSDGLLTRAGWLNVTLGLLSYAVSLPTGIAAWLRMGWKLEGNTLIHLILSVASLLVGIAAWTMMNKGERPKAYPWLALVTILLIGATGHFGSLMVHGG